MRNVNSKFVWVALSVGALSACSTSSTDPALAFLPGPGDKQNSDRAPASMTAATPTPVGNSIVRDTGSAGTTSLSTASSGSDLHIRDSGTGSLVPAAARAETRDVPFAPGTGHSGTPGSANPPSGTEAAGACPATLDKIGVDNFLSPTFRGEKGSVADFLTGAIQIGRGRNSISRSVSEDRLIMGEYFGDGVELGKNADQILGQSKAWCRAIQFVRGYTSNQCGSTRGNDQIVNHKMAAVLTAMLVVRNQPECVRLIREEAKKVLPDNVAELDEAALPLTAAAGYLHDGRLQEKFGEVAKNREQIEKEIKALDRGIEDKEKKLSREVETTQKALLKDFERLAAAMKEIPPCSASVRFIADFTISPLDDAKAKGEQLMADCKTRIDERLGQLKNTEADLDERMKGYAARREKTPNLAVTDQERADEQALANQRKQIDKYRGYLELLENRADASSVAYKYEKLTQTYAKGTTALETYKSADYAKPDLQKIKELETRYLSFSTQYLTYGMFGPLSGLPQSSGTSVRSVRGPADSRAVAPERRLRF